MTNADREILTQEDLLHAVSRARVYTTLSSEEVFDEVFLDDNHVICIYGEKISIARKFRETRNAEAVSITAT